MFIRTTTSYFNTQHIVRARCCGEENGIVRARLTCTDGGEYECSLTSEVFYTFVYSGTVVPAYPGFTKLLFCQNGNEEPIVYRAPVVAWQVSTEGTSTPVGVGDEWHPNGWAVLKPDGSVEMPCYGSWISEAEWFQSMCSEVGYTPADTGPQQARLQTVEIGGSA